MGPLILAWLGRDFEKEPLTDEELERAGWSKSWIPDDGDLDGVVADLDLALGPLSDSERATSSSEA